MKFPRENEYQNAVQNPHLHFYDPELRQCTYESLLGLPRGYTGRTTITFHLYNERSQWAVRCFKRDVPDLEKRYSALSYFMQTRHPEVFVPTECLQKGFFLNDNIYPIIKMQWVNGTTLDQFLSDNFENSETIFNMADQFRNVVRYLEREGIAHGDLQHGNIIVENGKLKIIDYDGIYLPEIDALGADDLGHPNYQHPRRNEEHYHSRLDRFSAIVIYLGLLAIAEEPRFFKEYHNQENIIFKKTDFQKPRESKIFKELLSHETIGFLCENFLTICEGKMDAVPSLDEFTLFNPFESEPLLQIPHDTTISPEVVEKAHNIPQKPNKQKSGTPLSKKHSVSQTQERERERYIQKIAYCLEILEDDPSSTKHLMQLAECYYNIGNFWRSLETYNQIKAIDPEFPRIDYWIEIASKRQQSERK